jgi:hypothetical protein
MPKNTQSLPTPSPGLEEGKSLPEDLGELNKMKPRLGNIFKGKGGEILKILNILISSSALILVLSFMGLLILVVILVMAVVCGLPSSGGNFAGVASTDESLANPISRGPSATTPIISGPISGKCGPAILHQASKYAGVCYSKDYHCANGIPLEKLQRWDCNGKGPGVDCSGFVSRVYRELGLFPPNACYNTTDILSGRVPYLQEISASQIQTGDLVVNPATEGSAAHVVIYIFGDVRKKFLVWEAGGGDPILGSGTKRQVRQAYRKPRWGQRYFHPIRCNQISSSKSFKSSESVFPFGGKRLVLTRPNE